MADESGQNIDWNAVAENLEIQLWRCVNGGEHQKASHVGAALQAIYLKRLADKFSPVDKSVQAPLAPRATAEHPAVRGGDRP
jgi:hypothetical protein